MIKFTKIFIKVVYWGLAIIFGFILFLTLPYIFLNDQLTKQMNKNLENKDYVSAMHLVGCYYDSEIAYKYEDTNTNISLILFRATPFVDTAYTQTDESGNQTEVIAQETIQLGYFGFLCNIDDYDTDSSNESEEFINKTKLIVNNDKNIYLLDYDENQDTKADCILTTLSGSFISFTIPMEQLEEVQKLDFIDKNGNVFLSIDTTNSAYGKLDFSRKFFIEFSEFVPRYNEFTKGKTLGTLFGDALTKEQTEIENTISAIFETNKTFKVGSFNVPVQEAQTKAYTICFIYCFVALILGDFIAGKQWILKFIKRLYKGKPKQQETIIIKKRD